MNNKKGFFFFIISTIIFCIFVIEVLIKDKEVDEYQRRIPSSRKLILPEFTAVDIYGNTLNSNSLKGKKSFIQFIDPRIFSELDLVDRGYFYLSNEKFQIVLFVENKNSQIYDIFLEKIKPYILDIKIIPGNIEIYKNIFNSPYCCNKFYVYDELGTLIHSEFNWKLNKSETLMLLENININKEFYVTDFITLNENVNNIKWLNQLSTIIRKDKSYQDYVVSMFNDFCQTCRSGKLLFLLNELHENNPLRGIIIFISDNYSENDRINFIKSLNIKTPVFIADKLLSEKWNSLSDEYGISNLNNIIFYMDKNGNILHIFDIRRPDFFFEILNDMD